MDGTLYKNVFKGNGSGNTITGEWCDVPGGRLEGNQAGALTLKIINDDRLEKVSASPPYGGSGLDKATLGRKSINSQQRKKNYGRQSLLALLSSLNNLRMKSVIQRRIDVLLFSGSNLTTIIHQ